MNIEINSTMKRKYMGLVILLTLFAFISCNNTGSIEFKLEVKPASYTSKEVPVHVEVKLPANL